ncbi:SLC7A9 [Mytilus coruscus]|uniref:SLC7A9 n=1 Tax=Mytilus coruscus TaxID=42192 RepID=A0A6J8DD50_MYTCO|nr:SLC7A9 [Mytilus coruscus]
MIETNNVTLEKELRVITEREDTVSIKRRLGFCSGVALIVDGIIGSGIFVSPKGILENTGSVSLSLVIWCVCGFISILSTYGSLATDFEGSEKNPLVWVSAIYSGMWAFGGWSNLNFVIEELQNPKRICFAAAREELFPEFLCYLNIHNNVPIPAIFTFMALAFVMMIPADLSKMLNLVGFIGWIFDGLIMVVHIVLNFRMKNVERPFKVPIIVPIIVIIFVLYMLISPFLEPVKTEFWYALSFLLAGVVLYIPFVFFKLRLPGTGKYALSFTINLVTITHISNIPSIHAFNRRNQL